MMSERTTTGGPRFINDQASGPIDYYFVTAAMSAGTRALLVMEEDEE